MWILVCHIILLILELGFATLYAGELGNDSLRLHPWKVGGQLHYGYLINHSHKIKPINEHHASGIEFFVSKQTHGENKWNEFFNYPEYGLACLIISPGSSTYVGTTWHLFPFLKFHLLNKNSLELDLRVGAGLAYSKRVYDAESNPINLAISTPVNFSLNLQFQQTYRINETWSVFVGEGLTHLSNGAYQMPNVGLNVITLFAGANYAFGKSNPVIHQKIEDDKKKEWESLLFILGGFKEIYPIGEKKYFAGGASFELSRKHLDFTRFAGMLDITYDASDYDYLVEESNRPSNRLKTVKIGIGGGYELLFGKLSVIAQLGAYLYAENKSMGVIYQRSGFRFALTEQTNIQLALRNQKGNADFVEFGLGYRF